MSIFILQNNVTILNNLAEQRALSSSVHIAGLSNVVNLGRATHKITLHDAQTPLLPGCVETVVLSTGAADGSSSQTSEGAVKENPVLPSGVWSSSNGSSLAPTGGNSIAANSNSAASTRGRAECPPTIIDNSAAPPPPPPQQGQRLEQIATMMADNAKTAEAIAKIYDEMWAEIRKSQAQRFQILCQAANSVSEIMMKVHEGRMQTSDAHHKAMLALIIDAPAK